MIHRWLTNRLAAHNALRAVDLTLHTNLLGGEIDRIGFEHWSKFVAGLKEGAAHYHVNRSHTSQNTSSYLLSLLDFVHSRMHDIFQRQHKCAADILLCVIPKHHLRHATAAIGRPLFESIPHVLHAEERETVRQALFMPPTREYAKSILSQLLQNHTFSHIGDDTQYKQHPHEVASVVAHGLSMGKTIAQITKQVKPLYDGSRAKARRIVRTYAKYLDSERTFASAEALGPSIVSGFSCFDLLGPTARPDHVLRSGTEYYRFPQPGQYSITQMPMPPVDRGGPFEDEIGIRWGCRCYVSPIISDLENTNSQYFVDRADRLIPDPHVFADWWTRATEAEKREAAGAKRLKLAREILDREPGWEDLIDPETGAPMPLDTMRNMTPYQRQQRAQHVKRVIDANRRALGLIGVRR